jgi:predicted PilT family ATPase
VLEDGETQERVTYEARVRVIERIKERAEDILISGEAEGSGRDDAAVLGASL